MEQYIVHIDLDFFYGQVEVALNPSLASLPFAIQQKHIVVTCNYLAREAGVKKLQLLTDAKRICPGLIIVLGEDIQKYRDASKAIFHHVRALLGDRVQRLGLDELWCDVTHHILQRERDHSSDWNGPETMVFNDTQVLHFDPRRGRGHILGQDSDSMTHKRLRVASHIAAYLRESIRSTFSFTSSGGISCSKLIAKLVGDCHKPNDQTLIIPEFHQAFLDTIEVKKIAGIGYTFLKVLFEKVGELPPPSTRTIELPLKSFEEDISDTRDDEIDLSSRDQFDDGEDFKLISKEKEDLLNNNRRPLTVLQVRTVMHLAEMVSSFGPEKGNWLYNILHSKDDSVVEPSSLYPKSIGLEDSFQHCISFEDVHSRLLELTIDLIHRIQGDLMANGKWVRWPQSLRLTPRFRGDQVRGELWRHKRTSKSVPFPVDAMDISISAETRALNLVLKVLMPLFSKIVADKGSWDLSLLNVGVADFKSSAPATGISEFLSARKRKLQSSSELDACPAGFDAEVWNSLDNTIKREVLRQAHSQQPTKIDEKVLCSTNKKVRLEEVSTEAAERLEKLGMAGLQSAEDDDWPENEDEIGYLCEVCESIIPSFAIEDHEPCKSR